MRCNAYQDPEVYDIAFNFRDFEKEVGLKGWELLIRELPAASGADCTALPSRVPPPLSPWLAPQTAHLLAMYQRHCQGPMAHFLEVASGPARHATAIAAATGAAANALDLSPAMLAYASRLADAAGVGSRLTTLQADMAAPGWAARLAAPADLAAVLLGSLAHCLDNGAALACFQELGWVTGRG